MDAGGAAAAARASMTSIGLFDQAAIAPRRHALAPDYVSALDDARSLKALLRNPIAAHLRDEHEATLLHLASKRGLSEAVSLLLKAGSLVDARTQDGDTALALALAEGHDEIAHKLLEAGASPNASNAHGETPLLRAARTGRTPLLRALVRAGGMVVRDADIEVGKTEVDKGLLRTAYHLFLFRWARTWKQLNSASEILAQARTDEDFHAALQLGPAALAILKDSPSSLAALKPRLNSLRGDWTTERSPLVWAVLAQANKCVAWLLDEPQGSTENERAAALSLALALKHAPPVELLVKRGTPVQDLQKLSFLPTALRNDLLPLARNQLIYGRWESSSDYDLPAIAKQVKDGAPPPLPRYSAAPSDPRYLLLAGRPLPDGIDPNLRDAAGCSLLHFAAAGGNEPATRLLLEKSTISSSDSQCTASGLSPLSLALQAKSPAVAELLLAKGATPTSKALSLAIANDAKEIAIRIARQLPKQEMAKYLDQAVRHDIPEIVEPALTARAVKLERRPGCELAAEAARNGATNSLAVLLEHGALPDGACGSLLEVALEAGKLKTAEMLARRGASASASDWNPLRLVLRRGARGVLRELLLRNAKVATKAHELEVDAAAGGFLEFLRRPRNPAACLNAATEMKVAGFLARLPGATKGARLATAVRTGNLELLRVLLTSGVRPSVDDVRTAYLRAFSRHETSHGAPPSGVEPDKSAQKQALQAINMMLLSRNWSGGDIDNILQSISSPEFFPSSLFGEILRTRRKLAPPPTPEALARIAVRATDADLQLLVAAYPSVLPSTQMWQAAIDAGDDKALMHVKAHAKFDQSSLLAYLQVAIDHRLPRTATALARRLDTVPEPHAAEPLVRAIQMGLPTVARVLLAFPGALAHPRLLATTVDPERVWLVGLLADLGAPDPDGLGMEALLRLTDTRPDTRSAIVRLLARGLTTNAMVRNAGKLENAHHLAEHFMATLTPVDEEDGDSPEAKILLDLVSALAARKHALPLIRDLVERLGAPLDRQDGGGYGTFPLWAAIHEGDVEVVHYLLEKHATVVSGCSEAVEALPTRTLPGKKAIKSLLKRFGVHPIGACGS